MLRKIWRNPQAVIGLGLIVLICAVAILAPLLAPHAQDEAQRGLSPWNRSAWAV